MTLQQVAQKAMDYLDSAGVAAEYYFENDRIWFATHDRDLVFFHDGDIEYFMDEIKSYYPTKSPAK